MNGRILISVSNLMVQCATLGIFGSGGGLVMGRRQTLKHCLNPTLFSKLLEKQGRATPPSFILAGEMIIFDIKCMLYFLVIILMMYLSRFLNYDNFYNNREVSSHCSSLFLKWTASILRPEVLRGIFIFSLTFRLIGTLV